MSAKSGERLLDKPLVSVIIPVYNGERYLAEAIESVRNQSYHPVEIVVVDDGSSDDTASIIMSFADVRYIYQSNQGQAAAKNTGMDVSLGAFFAFLDADDKWLPKKLSIQVDYLTRHPNVDCVIGGMINFLEPGIPLPAWMKEDSFKSAIAGYSPGTLLVRREVMDKVGSFDPSYKHADDCDWFFRAKDTGITIAVLPHAVHRRRIHSKNRSYERQAKGATEILRVVKSSIDRRRNQESPKECLIIHET